MKIKTNRLIKFANLTVTRGTKFNECVTCKGEGELPDGSTCPTCGGQGRY
jgi:DnaJ-class molecular chaperone